MRRCRLENAPAGGVLGCPVRNEHGAVLVQAGVALDARVLGYLRGLEIRHVYLEADPTAGELSPAAEEHRRRISQRERVRFWEIEGDPLMLALREATIESKLALAMAEGDDVAFSGVGPGLAGGGEAHA